MDELKKYFQQHRERLDTDVPADDNWQSIRRQLHTVAHVRSFPLFKWAVAACLIIVAGAMTYLLLRDTTKNNPPIVVRDTIHHHQQPSLPVERKESIVKKTGISIKEQPLIAKQRATTVKTVPPAKRKQMFKKRPAPVYGFENIEASYAGMLNMQLERVRTEPIYAEDEGYFHSFKKQFADLANEEEQLKKRIIQTGMSDEYVDELINIYQEKLTVLKRLRYEINKMNNRVRQNTPGIQQIQPTYIKL
jgi:hypothetical protein